MHFTRRIDNSIYSRKALADARTAYAKYCSVRAAPVSDGLADITVSISSDYELDARRVMLEFWNYFLDAACQPRVGSA